MAKVCIKSEKLTPFGEIFAIMEHFNGFFLIGSFDRKIESEEAYTIHLSKQKQYLLRQMFIESIWQSQYLI